MSKTVPIRAVCTFCNKELKAKSVDGVKVLEEKCNCNTSRDYFDPKVMKKPGAFKRPKEVPEVEA